MLLEKNAEVHLAARSGAWAEGAITESLTTTGKEGIWLKLDLSSWLRTSTANELPHMHERVSSIPCNSDLVLDKEPWTRLEEQVEGRKHPITARARATPLNQALGQEHARM